MGRPGRLPSRPPALPTRHLLRARERSSQVTVLGPDKYRPFQMTSPGSKSEPAVADFPREPDGKFQDAQKTREQFPMWAPERHAARVPKNVS